MRVLLLNPSHGTGDFPPTLQSISRHTPLLIYNHQDYPYDLAYIGAILRSKNIEVKIIDANSIPHDIVEGTKEFKPDVVGVTSEPTSTWECPVPGYSHVTNSIKQLKKSGVNASFIVMGPHGTVDPHRVLKNTGSDIVVRGEVEQTFVNVVSSIDDLNTVKGISYVENGNVIDNEDAELMDLDALPSPAYDLLEMKKYRNKAVGNKPYFFVSDARGCPYRCTYCFKKTVGSTYRKRNINKIVKELEILKSFGIKHIAFTSAYTPPKRILEICERVKELDMNFYLATRASSMTEETVSALKGSGCYGVGIGFESASNKILKNVKKDLNLEDVKRSVELGKKYGLPVNLFTILFLPGETPHTINETLEFSKKLGCDTSPVIGVPMPGTELHKLGIELGVLRSNSWTEALEKAGQIGTDFSREEILKYYGQFVFESSLSPQKIFNQLKRIPREPSQIKKILYYASIKILSKRI